MFFCSCDRDHRDLHSFPTRRSSDLGDATATETIQDKIMFLRGGKKNSFEQGFGLLRGIAGAFGVLLVEVMDVGPDITRSRSEEHTSELQSLRHLVCRLLLEKKNKTA